MADAREETGQGSPIPVEALTARGAGKARGRPRTIDGPAASLSVYLPTVAYDRLTLLAQRRGQSVSAYVREVLILLTNGRPG